MTFEEIQHVHIIGIGGIGISAVARLLVHEGKQVSGTNDSESPETLNELRSKGVSVSLDLNPKALPPADCYVYSDAWLTNHPEVLDEARSRGVPTLSYAQALGALANRSKCLIAITGAHGKTTTTAMLIDVLEAAQLDPSGIVGSLRAKTKSNFRAGGNDYFVAEADEYRRHFLELTPKILVITNIEADHLDYYGNLGNIQSAFRELAEKIPADGFIICNPAAENVGDVVRNLPAKVVDYTKYFDPVFPMKVLPLNRINAAAVFAVADVLGLNPETVRSATSSFAGTWRRFEYKGQLNGADIYDDYAHHPTEISTTLKSVREQFPGRRIIVAFHPHLYSRTKAFMDEFANAFTDADDVIIAPIFAAREQDDGTVSAAVLAEKIRAHGKSAQATDSFDAVEEYLRRESKPGDVLITMGAGDIYKVAEKLTA